MLRLFGQLLDRSLESSLARCLLCGASQQIHSGICAPCRSDLPIIRHACTQCALPLENTGDRTCPRCLQQPPPQKLSYACWSYAYPVAQLIQRLKYQRDFAAGRTLAELAAEQIGQKLHSAAPPDLLVPIPLHWRRQLTRGYNQAQLIADILGKHWQVPVDNHALRKVTRTDSQQQLRRNERLKNLAHSFAASSRVQGLHIGLVDDVITTGATLEAATQSLLDSGASRVSAYALARTP
ncbi:ComF family protein [Microbulbifer pacificus]|uniref:ComF family protein n=1 Tax=Microbulbifer pacificus TaxID=407164 RepID=A0AAU0MWT4_9GAMM|nr:ComF family protein [Microbulbifer pacificus]WOX04273.1 ComF family protein [Microbulbifer pacificus]